MSSVLEIGGHNGYSANNFLEAMALTNGTMYTVDINPVAVQDPVRHKTVIKDAKLLTALDVDNKPLDMVFFDCHVVDAQMTM